MNLIDWNRRDRGGEMARPIGELRRQMDRLFSDFFSDFQLAAPGEGVFSPRLDVAEIDSEVVVTAEVPGMTEKEVEVTLADGRLTISGEKKSEREEKNRSYHLVERSYGSFSRAVDLPGSVQAEKASATFKDGVLTVKVPKSAEGKARRIAIQGG
jgi:HSP20 family protein